MQAVQGAEDALGCLSDARGSAQLRAEQICQPGARRPRPLPPGYDKPMEPWSIRRHLQCALQVIWPAGSDCGQGQWQRLSVMQAEDLVYRLNQQGFMGHSDWRLSTVDELQSLRRPDCVV